MRPDDHYNEPAGLPEELEDHQPNDMPATRGIFITVLVLAAIALGVVALLYHQWAN